MGHVVQEDTIDIYRNNENPIVREAAMDAREAIWKFLISDKRITRRRTR